MRILGLLLLQLLFIASAYGQSIEFSAHLNSGLFSFAGETATESSFIIVDDVGGSESNYTNNPFGSNNAVSYGLAGQFLRVTSGDVVFGLQTGFELLRSSVQINSVNTPFTSSPASGNTILRHSFINVHPKVGYRSSIQDFNIDITVGPEVGFLLGSKEFGKAGLDNGNTVKTETERTVSGNDYRLRSSLSVNHKKWGLSIGYSHGLRNYKGSTLGTSNRAYSRFIRFGISYKLF